MVGRNQLEGERVHHRTLALYHSVTLQGRLTQPRFDVQTGGDEGGRLIEHQLGLGRVNERHVLQLGQEQRAAVAHRLRDADAAELPAAELADICVLDDPLLIADQRSRARRGCLLQLHVTWRSRFASDLQDPLDF